MLQKRALKSISVLEYIAKFQLFPFFSAGPHTNTQLRQGTGMLSYTHSKTACVHACNCVRVCVRVRVRDVVNILERRELFMSTSAHACKESIIL